MVIELDSRNVCLCVFSLVRRNVCPVFVDQNEISTILFSQSCLLSAGNPTDLLRFPSVEVSVVVGSVFFGESVISGVSVLILCEFKTCERLEVMKV